MMGARGKERDVAVQHEAPEFLACSDLDLSGSIVQRIKRPDIPGIEAQPMWSACCTISGGPGPFEDPNFAFLTVRTIFE